MKYTGKNSLSGVVRIVLILLMGATVAVVGFLPYIVDWYLGMIGAIDPAGGFVKIVLLAMLYPCGILSFLILNELRIIFKSLKDQNPFIVKNVKALKRIALYLFLMCAAFVYKIIVLNSMMTMVGAGIFLIGALLCLVLADVFHQAVVYKEENDLTI